MVKKILIIGGVIVILLIAGLLIYNNRNQKSAETNDTNPDGSQTTQIGTLNFNYILDYAEGDCKSISDCKRVDYGCGKTICTGQPDNYTEEFITDCALEENNPASQGYHCGCVPNEYKCGWIK